MSACETRRHSAGVDITAANVPHFDFILIYLKSEDPAREFPSPQTNCSQSEPPAARLMGGSPGCGEDVGSIQMICPTFVCVCVWCDWGRERGVIIDV